MPHKAPDKPTIIHIENWRGDPSRRGVLILGWSEMDHGPIQTDFTHQDPAGDGMRDRDGSLIGGIYAIDCERGKADFEAGSPPPSLTTASYDLGRQRAAEDADIRHDIEEALKERERQTDRALAEILSPEQYEALQLRQQAIKTGAFDGWGIPLSKTQRPILEKLAGGHELTVLLFRGEFSVAEIAGTKVTKASFAALRTKRVIEQIQGKGSPREVEFWTISLRGRNALKGDAVWKEGPSST